MNPFAVDYMAAALLGGLVGAGELSSRYRDAPGRALYTRPALFYIALNIAASVAALALTHAFGWTFSASGQPGDAAVRWTQVLVAGIGAMALFRSSLFTVRAGDRDIAVGPGSFLQIFREGADRAVDRVRAQARGDIVAELMTGISYPRAFEGLPTYCLALMQNVAEEDKLRLARSLEELDRDKTIDESIKVRILGLNLMNVVGPNVLTAAVKSLRDELTAGE
ncbi:MAG: hypothetical protein ACKV2U_19800 [Bryobacteraceae bacterium]